MQKSKKTVPEMDPGPFYIYFTEFYTCSSAPKIHSAVSVSDI